MAQKTSIMTEPTPREYERVRITVPWGHIAGRWYGDRTERPLLAIHGWLDNLGTWETLIPLLPQHIGVLSIDLPGHGRSSKYPKGMHYNAIDYMHVIIRVMREYKWQKVSLLTHSLGSIIAFTYTSIYPHTVDMIIGIDLIKQKFFSDVDELNQIRIDAEKLLLEDERFEKLALQEPPAYTYEELKQVLYEGSQRSVDIDKCHHLLNRNISKSKKYPDKFYFSRDGRVKYYYRYLGWPTLWVEKARRIKDVPYLIIKGMRSNYIGPGSDEIIAILRQNNPRFEFHEIDGTHHLHLNNPAECAAVINPFINAHRPAMPQTWSMIDDETLIKISKKKRNNKNETKGYLKWLRSKL